MARRRVALSGVHGRDVVALPRLAALRPGKFPGVSPVRPSGIAHIPRGDARARDLNDALPDEDPPAARSP
jgi:hypothetical protein